MASKTDKKANAAVPAGKEDLQKRTLVNNTQLAFLEKIGVLRDMGEENQLSLFNFL